MDWKPRFDAMVADLARQAREAAQVSGNRPLHLWFLPANGPAWGDFRIAAEKPDGAYVLVHTDPLNAIAFGDIPTRVRDVCRVLPVIGIDACGQVTTDERGFAEAVAAEGR